MLLERAEEHIICFPNNAMQMYGRNVGTNYRRMGLHQHDRLQNPILKVLLVPYHLSSGMIEVEEWSKSTREIYSGDFKKHLKSIPLEEEGGLRSLVQKILAASRIIIKTSYLREQYTTLRLYPVIVLNYQGLRQSLTVKCHLLED